MLFTSTARGGPCRFSVAHLRDRVILPSPLQHDLSPPWTASGTSRLCFSRNPANYLRLIGPIAAVYTKERPINETDQYQIGYLGLAYACRNWCGRGKFETYAKSTIRGHLMNAKYRPRVAPRPPVQLGDGDVEVVYEDKGQRVVDARDELDRLGYGDRAMDDCDRRMRQYRDRDRNRTHRDRAAESEETMEKAGPMNVVSKSLGRRRRFSFARSWGDKLRPPRGQSGGEGATEEMTVWRPARSSSL